MNSSSSCLHLSPTDKSIWGGYRDENRCWEPHEVAAILASMAGEVREEEQALEAWGTRYHQGQHMGGMAMKQDEQNGCTFARSPLLFSDPILVPFLLGLRKLPTQLNEIQPSSEHLLQLKQSRKR